MGGPSSFAIEHVTRYNYASPVIGCVMSLCLKPRDDAGQRLLAFDIKTDPPAPVNEERDSFGNTKHVLNVHREHRVPHDHRLLHRGAGAVGPAAGILPRRGLGRDSSVARLDHTVGLHPSQ